MSHAIVENYREAQRRIADGVWLVDLEAGLLLRRDGTPLNPTPRTGYCRVRLRRNSHGVVIHRVLWEYAHGPVDPDLEINHINGIKTDNRLENLEVVTSRENMRHARRTGLIDQRGERSKQNILTNEQVLEIHQALLAGAGVKPLARRYGVTHGAIRGIKVGRNWSHITGLPNTRNAASR